MLSIPHMIVVFVIVLVVFGPNKLPELARGLGKLMAEFRKASSDFKGAFEQEMREIERQAVAQERKKAAEAAAAAAAAAQPVTLATAPGTDTVTEQAADTRATEAAMPAASTTQSGNDTPVPTLVATPVHEAIARGASNDATSTDTTSTDTTLTDTTIENVSPNGNGVASADGKREPANNVNPHDSAHDTQQPV